MPNSGGRSSKGSPLVVTAVLRGLGSALAVSLVCCGILGTVYYFAPASDSAMSGLLVATNAAALLLGGLAAAKSSRTHGWMNGGLAGLIYVTALWLAQSVSLVPSEGLTAIGVAGALALGSLAGGVGGMLGMAVGD